MKDLGIGVTQVEDSPCGVTGGKTESVCMGGVQRQLDVMAGCLWTCSSDDFSPRSDMSIRVLLGVWAWERRRGDSQLGQWESPWAKEMLVASGLH